MQITQRSLLPGSTQNSLFPMLSTSQQHARRAVPDGGAGLLFFSRFTVLTEHQARPLEDYVLSITGLIIDLRALSHRQILKEHPVTVRH